MGPVLRDYLQPDQDIQYIQTHHFIVFANNLEHDETPRYSDSASHQVSGYLSL